MWGVLKDLETSALAEKEKALFRFVAKVNRHSSKIAAADMQPLYEAGWTDECIYFAITVCALFNFYNRWVDASGVHAMSDEAHREGESAPPSTGTCASSDGNRQVVYLDCEGVCRSNFKRSTRPLRKFARARADAFAHAGPIPANEAKSRRGAAGVRETHPKQSICNNNRGDPNHREPL